MLPVGDGTPLVSSPLTAALRADVAAALASREAPAAGATRAGAPAGGATVTAIGLGEVPFRPLDPPLAAEVNPSTARHPPPEVLRLRTDL